MKLCYYEKLCKGVTDGPPKYPPNAPCPVQAAQPTPEPIRSSFWVGFSRSRRQTSAVDAATCTFITAGMSIAFSIGFSFNQAKNDNWNQMHVCWFIGAIIGSLVGLTLVHRLTKRFIYFVAIGLMTVNGICFTSAPENDAALIIGLYCAGAGFGINMPAFIAAASEVSFKRSRGMILSIAHVGLAIGMVVEIFVNNTWNAQEATNRAHGIFVLVYVSLSVISNLFSTVESPAYYLRKGNKAEAIKCLQRLVGLEVEPGEVSELLMEHWQFLAEDVMREIKTNLILGLKTYPKIAVLFVLSAMSFSLPIVVGVVGIWRSNPRLTCFFLISRFIGTILGSLLLDTVGRRSLTAFSVFTGGVLLVVFGSIFSNSVGMLDDNEMLQAQAVIIIFQLFAGIVATASTTYLGEAFAVSVKQLFVVASVCLECIIHIIFFYACDIASVEPFCLSIGAIQILFAGYFFATTRETKKTTLRQALFVLSKPV